VLYLDMSCCRWAEDSGMALACSVSDYLIGPKSGVTRSFL
jgi:hypothetical protein